MGKLLLSGWWNPVERMTKLTIDHADPEIDVLEENLKNLLASASNRVTLEDNVLRVVGDNLTVVYVLKEYDAQQQLWKARWPD